MKLTPEQVDAVAPDAKSIQAGRKLAKPAAWKGLGVSDAALWGECQGSTLYQVRVDLSDLTAKCSCPSRKYPCKHALGLLYLVAGSPGAAKPGEAPEWVTDWLARRTAAAEAKKTRQERKAEQKPADPKAQERRAKKRQERVEEGVEQLELWLRDLVRRGLAGLESEGSGFWEAQAARLIDAQAPGLASRLRRLGEIPGSPASGGTAWPERLLRGLGRLELLLVAFRRLEELPEPLRADVRGMIGWNLERDEVLAHGDVVADRWDVLGQVTAGEDAVRVQRSWLAGRESGRFAQLLQFSVGGGRFPEVVLPGSNFEADLAFWPGAEARRALVKERRGQAEPLAGLSGTTTIDAFLDATAEALSRQPWIELFPCALGGVVPVVDGGAWSVAEPGGQRSFPCRCDRGWLLLALSGGRSIDVFGEWDGDELTLLGTAVDGRYHPLREEEG